MGSAFSTKKRQCKCMSADKSNRVQNWLSLVQAAEAVPSLPSSRLAVEHAQPSAASASVPHNSTHNHVMATAITNHLCAASNSSHASTSVVATPPGSVGSVPITVVHSSSSLRGSTTQNTRTSLSSSSTTLSMTRGSQTPRSAGRSPRAGSICTVTSMVDGAASTRRTTHHHSIIGESPPLEHPQTADKIVNCNPSSGIDSAERRSVQPCRISLFRRKNRVMTVPVS
jgi:hypothetical protein